VEDASAEIAVSSFVVVLVVPVSLIVPILLVVLVVFTVSVVPVVVVPVCWVPLLNLDHSADDPGWWCASSSNSSVLVVVVAVDVHGDTSGGDLGNGVGGGGSRCRCNGVGDSGGIDFDGDALFMVGDRGGVSDGRVVLGEVSVGLVMEAVFDEVEVGG